MAPFLFFVSIAQSQAKNNLLKAEISLCGNIGVETGQKHQNNLTEHQFAGKIGIKDPLESTRRIGVRTTPDGTIESEEKLC